MQNFVEIIIIVLDKLSMLKFIISCICRVNSIDLMSQACNMLIKEI